MTSNTILIDFECILNGIILTCCWLWPGSFPRNILSRLLLQCSINNYKLRNLNSTTDYDYTLYWYWYFEVEYTFQVDTLCNAECEVTAKISKYLLLVFIPLTDQHQPECQPSNHLKYFSLADQIWSKTMAILWYAALRAFLYNLTRDDICVLVSCYQNVHRLSHFNI